MKQRKTFLLRISHSLFESLEAWAQQELRSVNGQIEFLLQEAVRKRGRSDGRKDDLESKTDEGAERRPSDQVPQSRA